MAPISACCWKNSITWCWFGLSCYPGKCGWGSPVKAEGLSSMPHPKDSCQQGADEVGKIFLPVVTTWSHTLPSLYGVVKRWQQRQNQEFLSFQKCSFYRQGLCLLMHASTPFPKSMWLGGLARRVDAGVMCPGEMPAGLQYCCSPFTDKETQGIIGEPEFQPRRPQLTVHSLNPEALWLPGQRRTSNWVHRQVYLPVRPTWGGRWLL